MLARRPFANYLKFTIFHFEFVDLSFPIIFNVIDVGIGVCTVSGSSKARVIMKIHGNFAVALLGIHEICPMAFYSGFEGSDQRVNDDVRVRRMSPDRVVSFFIVILQLGNVDVRRLVEKSESEQGFVISVSLCVQLHRVYGLTYVCFVFVPINLKGKNDENDGDRSTLDIFL